MAKKVIKKTSKKTVTPRSSKTHHHWNHHDFLLVVGGGFIVIVLVLFASGGFRNTLTSSVRQTESQVEVNGMENQNEKMISINDFTFTPSSLVVKEGTTVTWTNKDDAIHSVLADDGSFNSGSLEKGESGSVTFTQSGTYTYHCSQHPNMTGTITVEK